MDFHKGLQCRVLSLFKNVFKEKHWAAPKRLPSNIAMLYQKLNIASRLFNTVGDIRPDDSEVIWVQNYALLGKAFGLHSTATS